MMIASTPSENASNRDAPIRPAPASRSAIPPFPTRFAPPTLPIARHFPVIPPFRHPERTRGTFCRDNLRPSFRVSETFVLPAPAHGGRVGVGGA
jgi:hypothetical protein